MVRLTDLSRGEAENLLRLPCPRFDASPLSVAPDLRAARVALVTSAGISMKDDETFSARSSDYRVIPSAADASDIVMSHASVNCGRGGFVQDLNTVFPIDRLRVLAEAKTIGSIASSHYSFMGATEPGALEKSAENMIGMLKEDQVNAVFLTPV